MWNISPSFRAALAKPTHRFRVKAEVLDTDYRIVSGGVFTDAEGRAGHTTADDIRDFIIDGVVDVDTTRAARRTFSMTLLNLDGAFSPGSDWGGMFYVDRLIRIYRGIVLAPNVTEWVPIGTFFIDNADVMVERNMSLVVLSGSDGWKKLSKSETAYPRSWPAETEVPEVIEDMANQSGVYRLVRGSFEHRSVEEKQLRKKLAIDPGTKVSDFVFKLADDFGLEVYFDVLGRMVVEDLRRPADMPVSWTFRPQESGGLLVSLKASYKDDTLYNDIVVVGTGDKKNPVTARVTDTDPASPTNIYNIGRRTFRYETDEVDNEAQAERVALKLFYRHFVVQEDVTLEAICNPAFEGNDAVRVIESDYTNLNRPYRVRSFSIPLSGSRQTIKLQRLVDVSR